MYLILRYFLQVRLLLKGNMFFQLFPYFFIHANGLLSYEAQRPRQRELLFPRTNLHKARLQASLARPQTKLDRQRPGSVWLGASRRCCHWYEAEFSLYGLRKEDKVKTQWF